jgi:vanillate O-demethylase monooxygenase subunit
LARFIAETFPVVVDQDRWVLERQQEMFGYPDEGYSEVHVRTDKALLVARKILAALGKHEQAQ